MSSRMLESQDVIREMCKLQAEVHEVLDLSSAADCFCREGGFWPSGEYGGTFEEGYRNDGEALDFIKRATRDALARQTQGDNNDNT